ncbi:MAG TPA: PIN domain-containing protein [Patescibacteria group bacterium]|nr:PIN domain-containing protein [Patescibacteria group bacterium]
MSTPEIEPCIADVDRKHILLDTCFIIECLRSNRNQETVYNDFIVALNNRHNTLAITDPVRFEFFKGCDTLLDRREKEALLASLNTYTIPTDVRVIEKADKLVSLYRREGKDIQITDIFLGATLIRYPQLLLLTSNHNDFPVKIFDRKAVIPLQLERGGIDVYGLYGYSETKDTRIMATLLDIEEKRKSVEG